MNDKKRKLAPGVGIAIGISAGVAIGVAMDNLAIGVAIGVSMGMALEAQHKMPLTPRALKILLGIGITLFVLFLAGILVFLSGSSGRLVVRSDYKNVTGDSGFVQVEGGWRIASDPKHDILTQINSVQIVCDKAKGTCTEIIALLYTARDEWAKSILSDNFLTALTQEYQVLDWSESAIVAIAPPPPRAADIELRISIEHKTAERIFQETEARGAQGALAQPTRWVLE